VKIQLQKMENGQGILIPQAFLDECRFTDKVNLRIENGHIIIESVKSKKNRPKDFVNFVMEFCKKENKGALAALKVADNPNPPKQQKAFHYLAAFHVDTDFDNQNEWLPYATIAAAIAKTNAKENGDVGIGRAIARCYGTSNTGDKKEIDPQAVSKIRRLLACDSTSEACRVLRPLFSLIEAKGLAKTIDYISLLNDLDGFHIDWRREKIKQDWVLDFYRRLGDKNKDDEVNA
jgi:CRISPR system Cascade subunit CasB